MSDVLNNIRNRVGDETLTTSCNGKKCRVDMTDVPKEQIVVNVDIAYKAHNKIGKHCDRILFFICSTSGNLVVVLIEHKGSTFDSARDIALQLQGGADFVQIILPRKMKTICVPVLFHGDGNHPLQFSKLRWEQISFDGKKYPIDKSKCNRHRNLSSVLKRAKVLS